MAEAVEDGKRFGYTKPGEELALRGLPAIGALGGAAYIDVQIEGRTRRTTSRPDRMKLLDDWSPDADE